ncbi:MAG: hypothetical protein C0518_15130 [Opitutus sp.]|nr:hypothetical protein [Opitutus sp.]
MKLVWHIFLKDLRRHRIGYLVYLALVGAQLAVSGFALSDAARGEDWFERQQYTHTVFALMGAGVAFFLSAAIVMEDSLVGSRLFWSTRPISGLRLLAAKSFAVVALFVVIPILGSVPWWIACDMSVGMMLRSAGMLALVQLVIVGPAMALAAVTGTGATFGRTLLMLLATVVVLAAVNGAGATVFRPGQPAGVIETRAALFLVCTGVLTVAINWIQFVTRRTKLSVAIGVLGVAFMVLGLPGAKWNFVTLNDRKDETTGLRDVRVELQSAQFERRNYTLPPMGYRRVHLALRVHEIPEDFRLLSGDVEIQLRWSDGQEVTQSTRLTVSGGLRMASRRLLDLGPSVGETDRETAEFVEQQIALAKQRGLGWVRPPEGELAHTALLVPEHLAQRLDTDSPSYRIRNSLRFSRATKLVEFPLLDDAAHARDGVRIRSLAAGDLSRETDAQHTLRAVFVSAQPGSQEAPEFCVVQRSTGYASNLARRVGQTPAMDTAPFRRQVVEYGVPRVRRGDSWVPAPGSDSGFGVVVLKMKPAGSIDRIATGARFPFTMIE